MHDRVEQIARVCHEANRAYCATLGDLSQPAWEYAPEWQKDSVRNGVKFHLDHLAEGIKPLASASHDAWLDQIKDYLFGAIVAGFYVSE